MVSPTAHPHPPTQSVYSSTIVSPKFTHNKQLYVLPRALFSGPALLFLGCSLNKMLILTWGGFQSDGLNFSSPERTTSSPTQSRAAMQKGLGKRKKKGKKTARRKILFPLSAAAAAVLFRVSFLFCGGLGRILSRHCIVPLGVLPWWSKHAAHSVTQSVRQSVSPLHEPDGQTDGRHASGVVRQLSLC